MDVDVVFIEIEGRKIVILTDREVIRGNHIDQLALLLAQNGYIKLSQKKLASINNIEKIEGDEVIFKNSDIRCRIPRRNIKYIKDMIRQK